MKNKKIISVIASVCLAAVVLVGSSVAYFHDETPEVVNTFTIGDVKIDLTEPDWKPNDAKDLLPGAVVSKNPIISNTGTGEGYVMMRVEGMNAMKEQGFQAVYDTDNWDLVDKNGNKLPVPADKQLTDGYYVYKGTNGAVEAGKSTTALFKEVKLSENATEKFTAEYKITGNFRDEKGLFSYEGANGEKINMDRQPTKLENGVPKVFYTINGVDKEFTSAKEAEDYVMEHFADQKIGFRFELKVQGFAIQSTNLSFEEDNSYKWVSELTGADQQ